MNKKWYKNLFIITNAILYLVSVALWLSITDVMILNLSVTAASVVLTLILLIIYRKDFYELYSSTYFKGFSRSLFSIILLIGILGFVNYLCFKHPVQWDLTANKQNTLTDQSLSVLKSMDKGISLTVFSKRKEHAVIKALLELYRLAKSDTEIKLVDIEVRPDLVKRYEIDKSGTVLVEYADKSQKVTQLTELEITNALIRLSREKDPVIFYSSGHGEVSLSSKENEGGSYLKYLLEKGNYEVKVVNLANYSQLPDFASALVIWGPKEGFHSSELKLIESYLQKGGKLMVALDPNVNNDKVSALRNLLSKWGVKVQNNLVVDKLKHVNGSNGSVPRLDNYNIDHQITKNFKGQVFFPLVSSIEKIANASGKLFSLAQSSSFPASWGEMSLDEFITGSITYNKEKDMKGPLGLFAAWEGDINKERMIVSGNSTFVINAYQKFSKNYALFMNSLNWLVGEKRLISFNLPIVKSEPVFISGPQLGIIFYFSVLCAPIALIIVAALLYRRRVKL